MAPSSGAMQSAGPRPHAPCRPFNVDAVPYSPASDNPDFRNLRPCDTPSAAPASPPPPVGAEALVHPPLDAFNQLQLQPLADQALSDSSPVPVSSKTMRFPRRPGKGVIGRKCTVKANHFFADLPDKDLHQYDVRGLSICPPQAFASPMYLRGSVLCINCNTNWHIQILSPEALHVCILQVAIVPDVASRGVNRAVIRELLAAYRSDMGNRLPVYDGRKSMYTAGPLPFQHKEFSVKLVDEADGAVMSSSGLATSSQLSSFLHARHILTLGFGYRPRERPFKVTIRFAARADLHHLGEFLKGRQADAPQEALQVLDIVLRELPTTRCRFFSPLAIHASCSVCLLLVPILVSTSLTPLQHVLAWSNLFSKPCPPFSVLKFCSPALALLL